MEVDEDTRPMHLGTNTAAIDNEIIKIIAPEDLASRKKEEKAVKVHSISRWCEGYVLELTGC